jgi:hypothetical protein
MHLLVLYAKAASLTLTVADFKNAPSIDEVDVSHYGGQTGEPIYVRTHDDFEVQQVQVSLADGNGVILEDGEAEIDGGTGRWVYHDQTTLTTGTTVCIAVSVLDRLPGQVSRTQSKETPMI